MATSSTTIKPPTTTADSWIVSAWLLNTPLVNQGTASAAVQAIRAARAKFAWQSTPLAPNQVAGGNPALGDATKIVKNDDGTTTTTLNGVTTVAPSYQAPAAPSWPSSVGNTGGTSTSPNSPTLKPGVTVSGKSITNTNGLLPKEQQDALINAGFTYNWTSNSPQPPLPSASDTTSTTPLDQTSALTEPTPEQKPTIEAAWVDKISSAGTKITPSTNTPNTNTDVSGWPAIVQPANEDQAFSILQNGGHIPLTKQNAVWQNHYTAFQALNSQDSNSIAQSMANGDIAPSMVDLLRKYSPGKYAEVEKKYNDNAAVDGINKSSQNLFDIMSWSTAQPTQTLSEKIQAQLIQEFASTPPSVASMKAKYYEGNDAMKESKIAMGVMEQDINDTKDQIAKIAETYRTQYPDAPQALIVGMSERASYDLNQKLTRQVRDYNLEYSKYQANKEDLDTELKFDQMQLTEDQNNRKDKLSFLQTLYTGAKADEDWQRSKDFEIEKIKDAQAYGDQKAIQEHTWNLAQIEDAQKFQSTENKLQRDQAMKIVELQMKDSWNKVVGKADDGSWYDVQDREGNISRKTPAELMQSSTPTQGNYKMGKNEIGFYTDNDGQTVASIAVTPWTQNVRTNGTDWSQCWAFGNDCIGQKVFGDKFSQKMGISNSAPKAGAWFIADMGNPAGTGHVGFINKVYRDASGNITGYDITDSNIRKDKNGKGLIDSRHIWPESTGVNKAIFNSIKWAYMPDYKSDAKKEKTAVDLAIGTMQWYAGAKYKSEQIDKNMRLAIDTYGLGSKQVKDQIVSYIDSVDGQGVGKVVMGINMMDNIQKDIAEYKKQNPTWELFGFKGNVQKKIDELNNNLASGNIAPQTRARIQLEQKILSSLQVYRHEMTGAAASALESQEYYDLFPKGWEGEQVSMAKIDGFKNMLDSKFRSKMNTVVWGEDNFKLLTEGKVEEKQPELPKFSSMWVDNKFYTSSENKASSFFANPAVQAFMNSMGIPPALTSSY